MPGTIEIKVDNRPDGTPVLHLKAADDEGCQLLAHIEASLEAARFRAVPFSKADIGTVCGSSRTMKDDPRELAIPLALGCVDLQLNDRIVA